MSGIDPAQARELLRDTPPPLPKKPKAPPLPLNDVQNNHRIGDRRIVSVLVIASLLQLLERHPASARAGVAVVLSSCIAAVSVSALRVLNRHAGKKVIAASLSATLLVRELDEPEFFHALGVIAAGAFFSSLISSLFGYGAASLNLQGKEFFRLDGKQKEYSKEARNCFIVPKVAALAAGWVGVLAMGQVGKSYGEDRGIAFSCCTMGLGGAGGYYLSQVLIRLFDKIIDKALPTHWIEN